MGSVGGIKYIKHSIVMMLQTMALCPYACTCGREPTKCGAGINPTVDGCNCCKVCPKQLGEPCNGQDKICDPMKRLYCDFTDLDSEMGTCKGNILFRIF